MKTKLQNIAIIQSGIYVKPDSFGDIVYLQGKDFNENGQLNFSLIPDLQLTNQTERHLLQDGDVLFAAKGNKNFAAVYEDKNGLCIASSIFMVIRIKPEMKHKLTSEFLAWFINHPTNQQWLKNNAIGSAMLSISKSTLLEMDITIPDVKSQITLIKLDSLRKQEHQIQKQLSDLKEHCMQQRLLTLLK